jgi:hypothetical protein
MEVMMKRKGRGRGRKKEGCVGVGLLFVAGWQTGRNEFQQKDSQQQRSTDSQTSRDSY